jgi:DNA polymerase-3 subunit epsilon
MSMWQRHERVAVVDFETTGMGPTQGARATEIGVVLLEGGDEVARFASLMRSDVPVPPFIERLTGISNAMLAKAPPAEDVMAEVAALTQGCPMVAHNASFDRGFWVAELARIGVDASATPFTCTVKLARRLYPQAPNCKLGTLAAFHGLRFEGRAHRALADALVTTALWQRIGHDAAAHLAPTLAGAPLSVEVLHTVQGLALAQWTRPARRSRQALLATELPWAG